MHRIITFLLALMVSFNLFGQDSIPLTNNTASIDLLNQEITTAPIVFKNDTLFYIKGYPGNFPVALRANQINTRLGTIAQNYNKLLDSLYLEPAAGFIKIKRNQDLFLTVTKADAALEGTTLNMLATQRLNAIQDSFSKEDITSTTVWLKRIGLFLLSILVFYALIKLINFLFDKINTRLSKIERKFLSRKGNLLKYFLPGNSSNIFVFLMNILRIALILFLLFICAPFMFSFFPFTEHLAQQFYAYIEEPVKYVFNGIINFIPSLFFIIIIGLTARYFVRVIKVITADIELGKLQLKNFHKDWARPTGKLASLLIYALALVLIFPYLPGSGSSAFQGVSIFIGAIISFGSTSAIANIIAGVVITYMRPFQIGDRVKIDNIVGDVIDKTILVTHLRTTKNEDVTIPNANILIGNIINYSSHESGNIILHTTVTLGYDVTWQQANELLIEAANRSPFLFKEPAPFVLQTSLDDFYVSYELNAYTKKFKKIPFIYSEIHKNILDVFDQAGVEILSPGYTAVRDGNVTTVPSQLTPETKSPVSKLLDHLTGRKQPIVVKKGDAPATE